MEEILKKVTKTTLTKYKEQLKDKFFFVWIIGLLTFFFKPFPSFLSISLKLAGLVILENLIIFIQLLDPKADFKIYETKRVYWIHKFTHCININSILYAVAIIVLKWAVTTPLGLNQYSIFSSYSNSWTLNGEFVFNQIITLLLVLNVIYVNIIKNNYKHNFSFIQHEERKSKWNSGLRNTLRNSIIIATRYLISGGFSAVLALTIFVALRVLIFISGFIFNLDFFAYSIFDLGLFTLGLNILSIAIIKYCIQFHADLVNHLLYKSIGSDDKNDLDWKQCIQNVDNANTHIQLQALVQLKRQVYFNSKLRKEIYQAIPPEVDPSAIKQLFTKVSKIYQTLNQNLKLDADKLKKQPNALAVYDLESCNCIKLAQIKPILSYACKIWTHFKQFYKASKISSTLDPYFECIIDALHKYTIFSKDWDVKDPLFNFKICLSPIHQYILAASVISDLIHHSAKEDSYGLVQYEAHQFIQTLLSTYQLLTKNFDTKDALSSQRIHLYQPLMIELERSINRCLQHYGKVFQSSELPQDLKQLFELKFKY